MSTGYTEMKKLMESIDVVDESDEEEEVTEETVEEAEDELDEAEMSDKQKKYFGKKSDSDDDADDADDDDDEVSETKSDMRGLLDTLQSISANGKVEYIGESDEVETVEEEISLSGMPSRFQKRHYYAVADVIKDQLGGNQKIAEAFAKAFASDNPNFKPTFFVEYATGTHNKKTAAHN